MHVEGGLLMRRTVKVIETRGEAFIDLFAKIVDALPDEAAQYAWYIVRLYGEGDIPTAVGCNMSAVLDAIDSDGAFTLTWAELKKLPGVMSQIFDLLIVGHSGTDPASTEPPEDSGFERLRERHDIVIEAFDSSEWRIGGRDERSVDAVAATLASTTIPTRLSLE